MNNFHELVQWFLISFPMCFSPGPTNIFCSDLGRRFRIKDVMPFYLGLALAVVVHSVLGGLGSSFVMHRYYHLFQFLKYLGCCYMIYLAYQMLKVQHIAENSGENLSAQTPSFLKGFVFQMINVKFISFVIMLYTQLMHIEDPTTQEIIWTTIGNVGMSLSACFFWMKCGRIMVKRFNSPRAVKVQAYFYSLSLFFVTLWIISE